MQPHGQSLKQILQEAVALRDRFAAVKDELDQTEFTGTAGNGQVVVNVRGTGEPVSVHIDPGSALSVGSDRRVDRAPGDEITHHRELPAERVTPAPKCPVGAAT